MTGALAVPDGSALWTYNRQLVLPESDFSSVRGRSPEGLHT